MYLIRRLSSLFYILRATLCGLRTTKDQAPPAVPDSSIYRQCVGHTFKGPLSHGHGLFSFNYDQWATLRGSQYEPHPAVAEDHAIQSTPRRSRRSCYTVNDSENFNTKAKGNAHGPNNVALVARC